MNDPYLCILCGMHGQLTNDITDSLMHLNFSEQAKHGLKWVECNNCGSAFVRKLGGPGE